MFQDDYKVTPKLTLNLGLRWDYLPTYNEAQDRWSFLNPNIKNPDHGQSWRSCSLRAIAADGVSCNCRTPVNNYYKNFGPRLGFAYAVDEKTVFRARIRDSLLARRRHGRSRRSRRLEPVRLASTAQSRSLTALRARPSI